VNERNFFPPPAKRKEVREIYNIHPQKYKLLIYEADKIDMIEPITFAWEITDPISDRPYQILRTSGIDYEVLSDAVASGVGNLLDIEIRDTETRKGVLEW